MLERIGEVRSILPCSVPVAALTATATGQLRHEIARTIGMHKPKVVALSPDKENITYHVGTFSSISETFHSVLKKLSIERTNFPRMIIYTRSFVICADIFMYFQKGLGESITDPVDAPNLSEFRLVDMYTSVVEQSQRDIILNLFTRESQLRIVVATVAFGMGVDCVNVQQIIHVGPPDDPESYIQETGRAGRNKARSLATLLSVKGAKCSKAMKDYMLNVSICRRDLLFSDIEEYTHKDHKTKCMCCDICSKLCTCNMCGHDISSLLIIGK